MYTFLTQYNSPNFTSAADARGVYGRNRTIEKIAIHWWGDPTQNPSFEGVVAHLCNPAAQVSAHFVATGTTRRVACLVDTSNISWATLSANPYTISIECDPRCRDEDYDVIGELVAELRATFGNLPLMRHSDVIATRCPGNYDLGRIDAVAATKIAKASDQYGMAVSKTITPVITRDEIVKLYADILERPADEGGIQTYLKSGMNAGGVRNALVASQEYTDLQARKAKAQQDAIEAAQKAEAEVKVKAEAERIAKEKAEQEAAIEAAKNNGQYTQADRDRDNQVASIVQWIKELLARIFK